MADALPEMQQLVAIGYPAAAARQALADTNGDVAAAATMLSSATAAISSEIAAGTTTSIAPTAGGGGQHRPQPQPASPTPLASAKHTTAAGAVAATVPAASAGTGLARPGSSSRLCCPISCDPDDLEALHRQVGWTPGRDHIRPSPGVRARKEQELASVRDRYASETDYILQTVFALAAGPSEEHAGKLVVNRRSLAGRHTRRFLPNLFAYNVPEGTRHFIM